MTIAYYLKILVRCASVLLALGGIAWGFVMVYVFAHDLTVIGLIDRIVFLAFLIALPTLFVMNAILVLKEWTMRSIRSFSLLFALVITSVAAIQAWDLLGFGHPTDDRLSNAPVIFTIIAVFFSSYLITMLILARCLNHETNK